MAEHLPQTRPSHSRCTASSVSRQAHSPSRGKIVCCAQDHRRLQSCHFNRPALMPFQTTVLFPVPGLQIWQSSHPSSPNPSSLSPCSLKSNRKVSGGRTTEEETVITAEVYCGQRCLQTLRQGKGQRVSPG